MLWNSMLSALLLSSATDSLSEAVEGHLRCSINNKDLLIELSSEENSSILDHKTNENLLRHVKMGIDSSISEEIKKNEELHSSPGDFIVPPSAKADEQRSVEGLLINEELDDNTLNLKVKERNKPFSVRNIQELITKDENFILPVPDSSQLDEFEKVIIVIGSSTALNTASAKLVTTVEGHLRQLSITNFLQNGCHYRSVSSPANVILSSTDNQIDCTSTESDIMNDQ